MRNHITILLLTVLLPYLSGCYQSIGFTSEKADQIIEQEIETSKSDDYQTNQQYKVKLHDGSTYEYCCVAWQSNEVVFFYKINQKDGTYEPHGHYVSSIKDIRYRDVVEPVPSDDDGGGFFFELLFMTIDIATEAAIESKDNSSRSSRSGKRASRSSRSSSSSKSGSKTTTGKRSRR